MLALDLTLITSHPPLILRPVYRWLLILSTFSQNSVYTKTTVWDQSVYFLSQDFLSGVRGEQRSVALFLLAECNCPMLLYTNIIIT